MRKFITTKYGLKIIYARSKTLSGVAVAIKFNAGSGNEGKGQQGLAHLTEHCLCNCSNEIFTKKELYDSFSLYPYRNAMTGINNMMFLGLCNKNDFEKLMDNLTSSFTNFTDFEKEFKEEKEIVLQEIITKRKTNNSQAFELMFKNTRKEKNFKYMEQELVAGSVESVSKLTMQDVLDFKNTYFSIENAIVSVVGNVKFSQVKNACKKFLQGRLKPSGKLGFGYNDSMPIKENVFIKKEPVETQKSLLKVEWKYAEANEYLTRREGYIKTIIGNVLSSMAFEKFRVKNSSCYAVSMRLYQDFKDLTTNFTIECAHDKVELIYNLLLEFIEEVKSKGLSRNIFDLEHKRYFDRYNLDATSLLNRARNFLDIYSVYGNILSGKRAKKQTREFEKITFEEINDYAMRAMIGKPNIVLLTKNDINIDKSKLRVLLKK